MYSTKAFKENMIIHNDSIYLNNLVILPKNKHSIFISYDNEKNIKMETMKLKIIQ